MSPLQVYMSQGYYPHPSEVRDYKPAQNPLMQGLNVLTYRQPGSNLSGYVSSADKANENIFLNTAATDIPQDLSLLHETEHLRGFRQPERRWDKMLRDAPDLQADDTMGSSSWFLRSVIDNSSYLKRKYPELRSIAYLNPSYLAEVEKGKVNPTAALEELIATLSSLESKRGIDLTQDPVLKTSTFKDPRMAESYRSMTGWRSTRWDAKDPIPYQFREDLLKHYIKGK